MALVGYWKPPRPEGDTNSVGKGIQLTRGGLTWTHSRPSGGNGQTCAAFSPGKAFPRIRRRPRHSTLGQCAPALSLLFPASENYSTHGSRDTPGSVLLKAKQAVEPQRLPIQWYRTRLDRGRQGDSGWPGLLLPAFVPQQGTVTGRTVATASGVARAFAVDRARKPRGVNSFTLGPQSPLH